MNVVSHFPTISKLPPNPNPNPKPTIHPYHGVGMLVRLRVMTSSVVYKYTIVNMVNYKLVYNKILSLSRCRNGG